MHDTRCLGLVHWDDPEGWYGEGGGRRVQDGEHMYTCVYGCQSWTIKKAEPFLMPLKCGVGEDS